ncbi:MAG: sterol desaturase family protein [Pseudomonadales bacterium]|nr:sterol desaturase family protein [Pseudomonadales bacterium]
MILNTLLLRALFPLAAVGVAVFCQQSGLGFFNLIEIPLLISVPLTILLLDLAIYGQHVAFHRFPLLWRLHKVHHADKDYDVTTGSRFHPIEILLSMLIKMAIVAILGGPVIAVILFEIILNGMAMFNHGNIALPYRIDDLLRRVIVTPDMHRVHHSVITQEMHRNFGFNLSIWDRCFVTYQAFPKHGHVEMEIGLDPTLSDKQTNSLPGMLSLPFRKS